jgi:hypothetical protein
MVVIMSAKMQNEIDAEVLRLSPPKETALGVMTRAEMVQLINKAVHCGAIIGWAHAERFTRERMQRQLDQLEYEMKCIKERLKDAEMELLAVQK